MKKVILLLLLSGGLIFSSPASADDVSDAALTGLSGLRVSTKVSGDVKNQLFHISAPAPFLGDKLNGLAEQHLRKAGLMEGPRDHGYPKALVAVDTDMATDEFTVTLKVLDLVSLVRRPDVKFVTTIWSRKTHPSADEESEIKEALIDLLDHLIGDVSQANPVTHSD